MSKPVFKIIDAKGRVTIPKAMRESSGIASGDVVTIIRGRGSIVVKKAFVLEEDKMSLSAKEAYAQAVLRELPQERLVVLLELAVRLLQEDAAE
jgi:looped-hinge helix DNA binding domain, AbrB family